MDNEPESFRNAVKALNKPQRAQLDERLDCVIKRWDALKNRDGSVARYDEISDFFDWARELMAEAYWDIFEQRFLNGEKGYRTPGGYDKASEVYKPMIDEEEPDVPYVDNHLGEPKRIPYYRTILLAIRALADKALEEGDKHE